MYEKFEKDSNAPEGWHHRCQCTQECTQWIKNPKSKYAHGHFAKDPNNRSKVRNKLAGNGKLKSLPKDPDAPEGFHHRCQCEFNCGKWVKQPYYALTPGCSHRKSEEHKKETKLNQYRERHSNGSLPEDLNAPKGFHHKCQCSLDCDKWVKAPNRLYAKGHLSKTESFRQARSETTREANFKTWGTLTEEQRNQRVEHAKAGILDYWENITEEQYNTWYTNQQKGFKAFLESLSEEEYKKYRSSIPTFPQLLESKTEEELKEFYRWRAQRSKEAYALLSEDEKKLRALSIANNNRKFWEEMTEEAFLDWYHKMQSGLNKGKRKEFPIVLSPEKTIYCDSSWEKPVYLLLQQLNLNFKYANDKDNRASVFTLVDGSRWNPDFELPELNILIEVKASRGPVQAKFKERLPIILRTPELQIKKLYMINWDLDRKKKSYSSLEQLLSDCVALNNNINS